MKFISKEEFLKQPKEVQDKIRELWNPQQNDVYVAIDSIHILYYNM